MNEILSKREKLIFLLIFFGMLLSSVLELFGLAILTPIVDIVAYPSKAVESSWYIRLFADVFRIEYVDTKRLLVALILFVAIIYVTKALYAILFALWQQRFVNRFSRRLSVALFSNYLYQPYEFHTSINTSTLISKATHDVNAFVNGVNVLLSLISESLFCFAVFVYLLVLHPLLTGAVFLGLGVLSGLLYWLLRKKAAKYGRQAAEVNAKRLKNIREGLAGIKETKISSREGHFIRTYRDTMYESQHIGIKQSIISIIPRQALEMIGMIGLLIALLIYALQEKDPASIVSTFTLLGIAVIKLLPYISRIMGYLNSFKSAQWSINRVYDDMRLIGEVPTEAIDNSFSTMPFEKQIDLSDVLFQYKSGNEPILNHVSATVPKGSSVAFCGRSGAGKTTTVDVLLGLLKPQVGHVFCDGVDVETNLRGWHANLSYVPQDIYLLDDTIAANVAFGCDDFSEEMVWSALGKAHLEDFVRGLPNGIRANIGEKGVKLSGGQRQRIGIARALYRNTPIIVFDEATSALDFETEKEILNTITSLRGEKTLIIITHRLGTIADCEYIYKIEGADAELIQYPGHPAKEKLR